MTLLPDAGHDAEMMLLLEHIYGAFNADFRDYAPSFLYRRFEVALQRFGREDLSSLRAHIGDDADRFGELLDILTIPVSAMFRDPHYFSALRREVIPVLKTYPSPKIWVAGCAAGEEAYSLAIMLREEGLLARSLIYATDINPSALARALRGIIAVKDIPAYTENYQKSGGVTAFSDYYHVAYGAAVLDRELRDRIVFAEHSLATDAVFSEVQLVSCRNVMIYFNRDLQSRSLQLFKHALSPHGFLGMGDREGLELTAEANDFERCLRSAKLYRKK